MKSDVSALIKDLIDREEILYAVFSSAFSSEMDSIAKLTLRPLLVKRELCYQVTEYRGKQVFHRKLNPVEAKELMINLIPSQFKQALICTAQKDFHFLSNKKQETTILKKPPTRGKISLEHNRSKQHVLEEGVLVPFFVELGIMTTQGKVVASKSDKFKQINRFLEMIRDVVPHLNEEKIRIIDFGCGKAYLTFALYHYLHIKLGLDVQITGLDLKQDVVEKCQELADKLGYQKLTFLVGDIQDYYTSEKINMVVTLHACNTATDAALAKAVQWGADVILSVPCCQHELFQQIKNKELKPLLKHGILKERLTGLVTDAARAQLLEICGYQTQILEFIDLEHTAKNLLIRAIRKRSKQDLEELKADYLSFKQCLHIEPSLESLMNFKF